MISMRPSNNSTKRSDSYPTTARTCLCPSANSGFRSCVDFGINGTPFARCRPACGPRAIEPRHLPTSFSNIHPANSCATINSTDTNDRTALSFAIAPCAKEALMLPINAGADPRIADKSGKTPLHYSARESDREDLALLIRAGADPNVADEDGMIPLHYATTQPPTRNATTSSSSPRAQRLPRHHPRLYHYHPGRVDPGALPSLPPFLPFHFFPLPLHSPGLVDETPTP